MTCHSQLELGIENLTVAAVVVGIPHSSEHWLAIASKNASFGVIGVLLNVCLLQNGHILVKMA